MQTLTNISTAMINVEDTLNILRSYWPEPRSELEKHVLDTLQATKIQLTEVHQEIEQTANRVRRIWSSTE